LTTSTRLQDLTCTHGQREPFSIYQEVIKRKKYLYLLPRTYAGARKKEVWSAYSIDDPGDVDSDMMQVEE
jgi:hypothetical protein